MSEYKKLSIKQWALEDRPREKLLMKGINSLSNAELLGILIGSGNQDESAVELSKRILDKAGNNLHQLGKLSVNDLTSSFKGIGDAKAINILAALELGRRRALQTALDKPSIKSSQDAYEIFKSFLADLPHEEFWLLLLNRANKVMDRYKISQGGISGTVVDVRLIMRRALEMGASSVILGHNHPSGNDRPSEADKSVTRKISDAGKIMDIPVIDHVIVAGNRYFSFADNGLL